MLTKKELATAYGIHENTFSRRISEFGIRGRRLITPLQLRIIINELGIPENLSPSLQKAITQPYQQELKF